VGIFCGKGKLDLMATMGMMRLIGKFKKNDLRKDKPTYTHET